MGKQSGNMILMLFGAIAIAGVLGTGFMATMKGPGRALSESSKENSIENNMIAATHLVVSNDPTKQDCDGDGTVEPLPFRTGAGPVGGGLVPLDSGAAKNDPWGKALGYCVWDHGKKSKSDNVATCGGLTANRLEGGSVTTENVLAIVSAGKDGIFQTTCNAWVDANTDKVADTPLIVTTAGSDDIVKKDTIESLLASGALAQLPTLPDSACVAGAEGTMRFENGVPQVCTSTGWHEIGGDSGSVNNFTPTSGVNPNTQQTSNTIMMSGYFGTRNVTVDNGAVLVVNGTPQGSSYDVPVGATVAIRGTSAAFPSPATSLATNPKTFTLEVGSNTKTWVLTTRGRTAPTFTVTPSPSNMNVTGPATGPGTAYSTSVMFTVTNTGEATSATINALAFSNTTNFEATGTNLCTGATVAGSATCTFYARAKNTQPGSPTGTVTVSATGATSGVANLTSTATGWACNLPWGGTIAHGASSNAYSTNSVPCGSSCPGVTSRLCTAGTLGGSGNFASCGVAACAACNLPWGGSIGHGASVTAYSTGSVTCGNVCPGGTSRTCNNGTLSGSGNFASCSVGACSGCTLPWGGSIGHGASVYAYSVGFDGSNCNSFRESRVCNNGALSGSFTRDSCMEASFVDDKFRDGNANPTFSSVSFGPVAAAGRTRYILVGVGSRLAESITSVVIGGVTATQVVANDHGASESRFYIAAVPSGTSGNVDVNASGATPLNIGIGVWRMTDAVLHDTANSSSDLGATCTMTINTVTDGFLAAEMFTRNDSAMTHTWTGSTERYDQFSSGNSYGGHSGASTFDTGAQTGRTVASNPSAGNSTHACTAVTYKRP